MKIGLSIWDANVEKIDKYRKERQLTRSGLVNMVLKDYFDSLEVAKKEDDRLKGLAMALFNLTNGTITVDQYRAEIERLSK